MGSVADAQAGGENLEKEACGGGDGGEDAIPCGAVRPSCEIMERAVGDEGRVVIFGLDADLCRAFEALGPVNEASGAFKKGGDAGGDAFDEGDGCVKAGQVWRERDGDGSVLIFRA